MMAHQPPLSPARRRSISTAALLILLSGFFLTNGFTIRRRAGFVTTRTTSTRSRPTAAAAAGWELRYGADADHDPSGGETTAADNSAAIQEAPFFAAAAADDDVYFAHPVGEPAEAPRGSDDPKRQHYGTKSSEVAPPSNHNPNHHHPTTTAAAARQQEQQLRERSHGTASPTRIQVSPTKDGGGGGAFPAGGDGGASTSTSRREWLRRVAAVSIGGVIGGGTLRNAVVRNVLQPPPQVKSNEQKLAPINLTAVAQETSVNVTLECTTSCVSLDTTTFQKKRSVKLPSWFPPYLVPEPIVIKDIPNSEVWAAAIVAGSVVEMGRTSLLYPLLTLKTRIQNDVNHRYKARKKTNKKLHLHLLRRLRILQLTAKRHIDEGNLYAGVLPQLAVAAPATGVYYGTSDLTKRALAMLTPLSLNSVQTAVLCAFVADVVSLVIRTPADALAIRLQVATGEESHHHVDHHKHNNYNSTTASTTNGGNGYVEEEDDEEDESEAIIEAKVGNWFVESIERLPAVILTDLPYLLTRIAIKKALISGEIDIGRYELTVISTAILCAFLTTPFDVARTRILVDSDDDATNGIDGGSGEGLVRTMKTIVSEGDGGIGNLYAGWFERTLYLGIVRALLDPFQLVGYTAMRDAILLEAFD